MQKVRQRPKSRQRMEGIKNLRQDQMNKPEHDYTGPKGGTSDVSTDQEQLVGLDTGRVGVLAQFKLVLDPEKTKGISEEALRSHAERELSAVLLRHCENIGWWPDPNYPDYQLIGNGNEYTIKSFLKQGTRKAKGVSEFKHRIGINTITDEQSSSSSEGIITGN